MARLTVKRETFPLKGVFRISRGARTEAEVIVAEIETDGVTGRGECVPYKRYGETMDEVAAAIESVAGQADGLTRNRLQSLMPPGAARNAVDCALWDQEAKRAGKPVWELAGLPAPKPLTTAYTLSLDTAEAMAASAKANAHMPLLKLKLTGEGDLERVRAIRENAPKARLIVDANEAWSIDHLKRYGQAFADLGVEMIEQPLPAGQDAELDGVECPVLHGADESCHDRKSLAQLKGRYRVINIKLDKTGGLTEALALEREARAMGFDIMVGCMVGTSLAMAPATLVAQSARFVDVDGPLLMAKDREPGLRYDGATVHPPEPALWG